MSARLWPMGVGKLPGLVEGLARLRLSKEICNPKIHGLSSPSEFMAQCMAIISE